MDEPEADGRASPGAFRLALAALILGLLALSLSVFLAGGLFALAGLALAGVHLARRRAHRTMAFWGLGLSLAGAAATAVFATVYYRAYRSYQGYASGEAVSTEEEAPQDWRGVSVPSLTLTSVDGQKLDLSSFKGRRVVLNFWATWCGACKQELPHLSRLARETSPAELVVIGVSDEPEATLQDFSKKHPIDYALVSASDLPEPFDQIHSIPTTFFIDRQGVIQDVRVGYQDFGRLKTGALQADYAGTPRPGAGVKEIDPAPAPLKATLSWESSVKGAVALAACDWDGDGTAEVLVAEPSGLAILDGDGRAKGTVGLPDVVQRIECVSGMRGPRVLVYQAWGPGVSVMDRSGRLLWSYRAEGGVDGAHWADLDGDGVPEMIVGMNGDGGLHAVGDNGRRRWVDEAVGNVWAQAAVPPANGRTALVFATEAGGAVHVYDGDGQALREVQPLGDYYTSLDAAVVDAKGSVQVVAAGQKQMVAFDTEGQVAWRAALPPGSMREKGLAHGDLAGDAGPEWVFRSGPGLTVASLAGLRLAELTTGAKDAPFLVLPRKGKGLLVTLAGDRVQAYRLE